MDLQYTPENNISRKKGGEIMAYTTIQNSIYNHYLTSYGSSEIAKRESHKTSELRSLYNSMIKLNKDSPLYLIPNAQNAAKSAIDLKEMAHVLKNDIAALGGLSANDLLGQKIAYSSDPSVATAVYIGDATSSGEADSVPSSYKLQVRTLASSQINLGEFLISNNVVSLPTDTYSFDISIRNLSYEFQFNINKGDTNKDIQNRLSRLINNSGIGLKSKVIDGEGDMSSIQISSIATGHPKDHFSIFTISENESHSSGAVSYFGLDYTAIEPVNASFSLNGEDMESDTNILTIGNQYELTLQNISQNDSETTIGLKNDYESLTENIQKLFSSYNNFVQNAAQYQSDFGSQLNTYKFNNEINNMALFYKNELNSIGAQIKEDGTIQLATPIIDPNALQEQADQKLDIIKNFANKLIRKTSQISLDPLQYTLKKIVAYKNPGHNYAAPYVSSNYSGVLFNFYC